MQQLEPPPEKFRIQTAPARGDERTRVLKHGESFGVFDRSGCIPRGVKSELGLFHDGTRYLDQLELALGGQPLLLLSSASNQATALVTDLTNSDLFDAGGRLALPRDTLHLLATGLLWQQAYYLCLHVRNYGLQPVELELQLLFGADYADIFEVRGTPRQRHGQALEPMVDGSAVVLGYQGLDGRIRRTRLLFDPAPEELAGDGALYRRRLAPHEEATYHLTAGFELQGQAPRCVSFSDASQRSLAELHSRGAAETAICTSNQQFNEWVYRSATDLQMMVTETPEGPYPFAGIPWFSTYFGRDGIVTALQTLWMYPQLARGVLSFLARTQADRIDPERDAEPGKILHEMRGGEMAALGEVPFGCYYGTVDATPLFVVLAGEYWTRTADRDFLAAMWPHVERALAWIDRYGDVDGDGFVEYSRRSSRGLLSQGWKDSADAISHRDGAIAVGPVALCEVQAYVSAARRGAAVMAAELGAHERAVELTRQAEKLRREFDRAFWLDELSTYALALDGSKRPCAVRASNAGHCLFAGIADAERAARVAGTLLAEGSFSGWGIRTLDSGEARYNPMSYHNGSVWPHDNALIAAGLCRYGLREQAARVLAGMYDASSFVDLHRMPELFCGFARRPHEGPTLYPVACAPQAWSACAVFLLLQSLLGLVLDAPQNQIRLHRPDLPKPLNALQLRGLRMNGASVDLTIQRHPRDAGVTVERKTGEVDVVVMK
jgi:glycogen debranching enzyme